MYNQFQTQNIYNGYETYKNRTLGSPGKVARVQSQSAELLVAAAHANNVNAFGADLDFFSTFEMNKLIN